ncbi:MAG: FHA domain-containing protein [Oscillospiraceae bacterium]|jgi:hypothetical protein|nr:FHA domain-containing protein [Oscillospiraceae bacterium]
MAKQVSKKEATFFLLKTESGQQISARELQAVVTGAVPELIRAEHKSRGGVHSLRYDTTGLAKLTEYLAVPLTREAFAALLAELYLSVRKLTGMRFEERNILLRPNLIYIRPETLALRFIYVPVQMYNSGFTPRELYAALARNIKFSAPGDEELARRLGEIVGRGINLSLFDLEEFIKSLSAPESGGTVVCEKCGRDNAASARFCVECGATLGAPRAPAAPPPAPVSAPPAPAQDETERAATAPFIRLARTGAKMQLQKETVSVGKSRSADFPITDNPSVSRIHAKISVRGGQYSITDCGSTNGTKVNGVTLQPNAEYGLLPGAKIIVANEELDFY